MKLLVVYAYDDKDKQLIGNSILSGEATPDPEDIRAIENLIEERVQLSQVILINCRVLLDE